MSFASEVASHRQYLLAAARRLTGGHGAEDLVHDAMVKALEHESGFEPGTNMRAWLRRILTNHFLNLRGREALHRRTLQRADAQEVLRFHAGTGRSAEDRLADADVRREVDALPDRYAGAVRKVDLEGLRYREAAAALGVPVGTVMSRLHRGRRALAGRLRAA